MPILKARGIQYWESLETGKKKIHFYKRDLIDKAIM